MLARDVAERVLARALSTGADYAEIYLEDAFSGSMRMLDGKVDEISSGREHGAGVRVFKGLMAAYAYSTDTSENGLLSTAYKAALAVSQAGNDRPVSLPEMSYARNISPIRIDPESVPHARKIELLPATTAGAKDCGEKISQVSAGVIQVKKKVFIANTDGQFVADERCRVRLTVMAVNMEMAIPIASVTAKPRTTPVVP
jgi:TldD protein